MIHPDTLDQVLRDAIRLPDFLIRPAQQSDPLAEACATNTMAEIVILNNLD